MVTPPPKSVELIHQNNALDLMVFSSMAEGGWDMQDLSPDQVVALASCFIWQERAEAGQKVREDIQGPYGALCEAARTVAKVCALHALPALYAVRCLHAPLMHRVLTVCSCILHILKTNI